MVAGRHRARARRAGDRSRATAQPRVESTLAWIMAILAFPASGGGLPAGGRPLVRRPRARRAPARLHGRRRRDGSSARRRRADAHRRPPHRMARPGQRDRRLAESETPSAGSRGAGGARRSIWASTTSFATTRPVTPSSRAAAAAGRGSRCGCSSTPWARWASTAAASPSSSPRRSVAPFLPLNPLRRRWAVHLRNHRKLVIVDGETAFTGG